MQRVFLICVFISSAAFAVDDTTANRSEEAARFLQAAPAKGMLTDIAQQIVVSLPPSDQERFRAAFVSDTNAIALEAAMKKSLVRRFSADELKALADFWSSPAGNSAMKKWGAYGADLLPVVNELSQKAMAKNNHGASEEK